MTDRAFEIKLKKAVHNVCMAMAAWDASSAVTYAPSNGFIKNLDAMLSVSERRLKRNRVLLRVAACFAAVLIAFAVAFAVSPAVRAAVRNWYINVINPNELVYEFNHEENDHAFLVVRPDSLPEGFELTETDEGDGYSNRVYTNKDTGEHLKFYYHWATVGDLKKLERLEKKHGQISIFMGQLAVAYEENGLSKLSWYDKYSGISYWAESSMSKDALIGVFKESIEMHPPLYEPTWLPEGYVLYDTYIDAGGWNLSYHNEATDGIIVIECSDLGDTDQIFLDGSGLSKDVLVNNVPATVYWGEQPIAGTVLVLIDESRNLVTSVYTVIIDPDLAVKIAEGLKNVDAFSQSMP